MPDLGEASLLYSARPSLILDGREDPNLDDAVLAMSVEETTAGLYCAELVVGNWGATGGGNVGYLYFDRQLFDFGKSLSIQVGEADTAASIFEGRISGLEGRYPQDRSPELLILAEDRLQDLRMTRRTRTFEDVSDRDVIEQVARQHNLRTDLDVDGPTYRVLAQVNQSDLAFLRERVRSIDAELWIEGDTLHAQSRARRESSEVTMTYGQALHEFSVTADLAGQRTELGISGWDVQAKEGLEEQVGADAIQSELDGGLSGSELLQSAFGSRVERIVHAVPWSAEEAQAVATASFRNMARRFVRGRALCEGDGRIRVGTHVRLQELGTLFDGVYYVTRAKHTFDLAMGFRTHLVVERPSLGRE